MKNQKELSRAIAMATDQTEEHAIDEALVAEHEGIQPSKISPHYLHSNSTSHTWVFSAIAELIDNACDANAKELKIDKREIMTKDCLINPKVCLTLLDNGKGMTHEELSNMLSFGFSMHPNNVKIGKFGNGFKAGSMRIGDDAMVFTRCKTSTSIGLLSQTYLKAIKAKYVIVPIVTWTPQNKDMNRESSIESDANLSAILEHGLFSSEEELMHEIQDFEKMKFATGTKIVIFNVRKDKSGKTELDFSSDPIDIRNPETALSEKTPIDRPVIDVCPEYRKSLREYCSILYLKPRMRIVIQGRKVQTKLIDKSLLEGETDVYNPTWLDRHVRTVRNTVKITFGFTRNKDTDPYGLMLYHKNRLIDAYRKVGCQKKGKGHGIGVIGVVEAYFLEPTQNKQEFINNQRYNTFINAAAGKLNDYYYTKSNTEDPNFSQSSKAPHLIKYQWVQCDNCNTWRRLPAGHTDEKLSDVYRTWSCKQNPDVYYNRCDIPEEPEDESEKPQTTYKKTYKKAKEEKRRKEKFGEAISTNYNSTEPNNREPKDQIAGDVDEDIPMKMEVNLTVDKDALRVRTTVPITVTEAKATESMKVPSTSVSSTIYSRAPKRNIGHDFCSQKTKQRKNESPKLPVMDIDRRDIAQFNDVGVELNAQSDTDIGNADTESIIFGADISSEETIQAERTEFEKMEVQTSLTASQSISQETNFLPLMLLEHGQRPLDLEGSIQKPVRKITESEKSQPTLLDESKELETLKRMLFETRNKLHDTEQTLVEKTKEQEETTRKLAEITDNLQSTQNVLIKTRKDLEGTEQEMNAKEDTLLEKTKDLEETKQTLTNLRTNIWEMLKILFVSDFASGEPENIDQVIMDFIQHF
ncbi:MORC family CW-type zinc finger protein 3-like [Dreissena polymorpha]|nr:MORC family CW-type zinc finger protein 3-like [Dreissena polymorpha]